MTDILTAISILLALLTWLITYLHEKRNKIKEHTAQILMSFNDSENLTAANYAITKAINSETKIDMETISEDMELKVVTLLDHYEFICEMLFLLKIIDCKTLLQLRGRLMCKTYKICDTYIKQTREKQGRKVYESFEKFVHLYEYELHSNVQQPFDFFKQGIGSLGMHD